MEGFFSSSTMSELRCFLSDSLDLSPMITRWQYLQARDLGLIPGLGRSPGEEKGYPLQYSGLENSMGCIVHGVAKSRRQLSDFHFHFCTNIYKSRHGEARFLYIPQQGRKLLEFLQETTVYISAKIRAISCTKLWHLSHQCNFNF